MYENHTMSAPTDRPRCEGCGRHFPVDDLYTVTLPNGDTTACCEECKEYAEAAARKQSDIDQARVACDGCSDKYPVDELTEVTLFNGSTVRCCPECVKHAPRADAGGARSKVDGGSSGDAGASSTGGTTGSGGRTDRDDATAREGDGLSRNMCGQCRDLFSVELYEVETVDGRTERFCADCKDAAIEDGVVKNVRMRRAEAYRVLGVTRQVDEDELREVYLDLVRETHPDRENGDRQSFKEVQRAYERLTEE